MQCVFCIARLCLALLADFCATNWTLWLCCLYCFGIAHLNRPLHLIRNAFNILECPNSVGRIRIVFFAIRSRSKMTARTLNFYYFCHEILPLTVLNNNIAISSLICANESRMIFVKTTEFKNCFSRFIEPTIIGHIGFQ